MMWSKQYISLEDSIRGESPRPRRLMWLVGGVASLLLLLGVSAASTGVVDAAAPLSRISTHVSNWSKGKGTLGFGHVYLISTSTALGKQARMRKRLNYLNVDYEVFHASESRSALVEAYAKTFESREDVAFWQGAWALIHTQRRVLEDAVTRNFRSFLMLEDDADFEADSEAIMQDIWPHVPADWDILWLGYCNSPDEASKSTTHPRLFKATGPQCTHALAFSHAGALKLLNMAYWRPSSDTCPIDNFFQNTLHASDVSFNGYSITPMLSVQKRMDPSEVIPALSGDTWFPTLEKSVAETIGV